MPECISCQEAITNPVCEECVQEEIETWLYETKPELVSELRKRTYEVNIDTGDTNCIICNKNMSLCTFCYREYVQDWLKDHPELLEEYQDFFRLKYFF